MLDIVDENKVWTLEIAIGENADETEAQARLRVDDTEMEGWGRARRRPGDPERPRVGEELAGRAGAVGLVASAPRRGARRNRGLRTPSQRPGRVGGRFDSGAFLGAAARTE